MFYQKLKLLRKKYQYTQEDLAKALNYTQGAINSWEHNISRPPLEIICQINRIFKVSTDYLICKPESITLNSKKIRQRKHKS
ncbi:helix-turn-helix domain-containing protein [Lentilactobacillus hilgardii]|jgi:transcriptional regulator with XRE-family HTH domain|uniref:Helix-turn-helix domain-containing protein n=1 Tax=Lentilactobacillus hilgardii TaxID=1588 RepID=A0A6P1E695_LENHI|nr:DNA-binding helix-turn-helix protein [Lentilactobacillus hilgardii ATCC 27305]MCT3390555.1 XRE family transcriptional regulator [Lentilactobacillus hilgardii]QHB52807.1 helix-turn-helix domain-containing protein [Lentilactobacillus hilgardii]RRG12645.1 MAG: XRE family transcriptional regulator [Lactobacillus sp.]